MVKRKNYLQVRIEHLLQVNASCREDDQLLYFYICTDAGIDPDKVSMRQLFTAIKQGVVPTFRTVARVRAMVQGYSPQLRGKNWNKNHAVGQTIRQEINQPESHPELHRIEAGGRLW
jgi:hypothetical protein